MYTLVTFGKFLILKVSRGTGRDINIDTLCRLPTVATDVVVSVSVPMQISDVSSSRDAFQFENTAEVGAELFKQAVQSFSVNDWSLFQ